MLPSVRSVPIMAQRTTNGTSKTWMASTRCAAARFRRGEARLGQLAAAPGAGSEGLREELPDFGGMVSGCEIPL